MASEMVLWSLLIIAAITDLLWGKVYNFITLPLIVCGLFYHLIFVGYDAFRDSIIATIVSFLILFPFWKFSVFGGGDVKVLMAVAAWTNVKVVVELGFFAILVGAIVGLFELLKKDGLLNSIKSIFEHLKSFSPKKSHRMPFGPAFLCGFLLIKIAEMKNWSVF